MFFSLQENIFYFFYRKLIRGMNFAALEQFVSEHISKNLLKQLHP